MTELFEEKDLKAFEEVEGEQLGEIEYTEESVELDVELDVEFEIPEPEEVQEADQVQEFIPREAPPGSWPPNLNDVVDQVIAGEYGTGQDRRRRLEEAGIDHRLVQKELVRRMNHR